MNLHYKPTAAELVAAVAEFLETEVRESGQLTDALNFQARVAANVLRMVERELLADATDTTAAAPLRALEELGFDDEAALAAAIRSGATGDEVLPALRALVAHRLAVAHPGYERE
ncbi:hypothetical protein C1S82_02265 [Mycolicibacterium cosmeticum]|uniref:Aminoglycoside phosphotransferase n=1 Tax=Mycolicibacterium cosmeticum TaxID=258533 RepID=W9AXQ2_MYCCO|nr:DUF6285 domain-containing protein [Mycolicibacterium cosmeticum]TLH81547.1 hypothetical protein C1S82_02265 [Mycolicibacterium cosmeticum]CDO10318.1 aminoglycoside phosphotransferase [Mycolicibacterium cosmeticum]